MILLFLQYLFVTTTASVIFEDCGSAYELQEVNINGCGRRLPCYITLGDHVPVTMHFVSDFESRKLAQDVLLKINFITLRTDATPEPCATVHCPVRSDAVTSYTSVMTVPTNVAVNQRGYLRWKVYNDENRLVLCYSVLVQTQTPLQKYLRSFNKITSNKAPEDINAIFESNLNKTVTKILMKALSRPHF